MAGGHKPARQSYVTMPPINHRFDIDSIRNRKKTLFYLHERGYLKNKLSV